MMLLQIKDYEEVNVIDRTVSPITTKMLPRVTVTTIPNQTSKPYGFMQSCSVLLPSQIHMTKFTPHLGYFFQFNQKCGKN